MNLNKIPLVYFHSVAPRRNRKWVRNYLTTELKYFEDFLIYIKLLGYRTISLDEYFFYRKNPSREKMINIQFDDGYLDNWVYVYPLLKKYQVKITLFISPEFVEQRKTIRYNIEDVSANRVSEIGLEHSGFLSWNELNVMKESGLVEIQSHTLTHTKYFVSDRIKSFHHPDSDSIYVISNLFPQLKPDYISNDEFNSLVPFGYPIFEEKSAVVAKRVFINPDFINEVIEILKKQSCLKNYSFEKCYNKIRKTYIHYKNMNTIIEKIETDQEYLDRLIREIAESKRIIENNLNVNILYCCWPHGENNQKANEVAFDSGYQATSLGKYKGEIDWEKRFDRFAIDSFKKNRLLTMLKNVSKIKYHEGNPIFYKIAKIYNR